MTKYLLLSGDKKGYISLFQLINSFALIFFFLSAVKITPSLNYLLVKSSFLPKIESKSNFIILTYLQTSSIVITPFLLI